MNEAVTKDELAIIENALKRTWGKRDNLFSMGTPLNEIEYRNEPERSESFERQLELYFSWMLEVQDRRTRRIVKGAPFTIWRTLDPQENNYNKIIKDIEEGKIEPKVEVQTTLQFNLNDPFAIETEYPELETKAFNLMVDGDFTQEDIYKVFVADGDEQHREFAEKYGTIKEEKTIKIPVKKWQDKFWSYGVAIKYGPEKVQNKPDQYVGCNPVFTTKVSQRRLKERVTELDMLYSELDYYKLKKYKKTSRKEMLNLVFEKLNSFGFPCPSEVTFSRGLQLIWRTNPVGQMRYTYWVFLQRYIYNLLEEFGADPVVVTDSARVLRSWGSIHSGTGEKIYGYTYLKEGQRFDFDDLLHTYCEKEFQEQQQLLQEKREQAKKRHEKYLKYLENKEEIDRKNRERANKRKRFRVIQGGAEEKAEISEEQQAIIDDPWNIRHERIINDIFALVEHRKGNMMNGSREIACFLVRYYRLCTTGGDTVAAINEMKDLFDLFDDYTRDSRDIYTFEGMLEFTKSAETGYKKWASRKKDELGRREGYNYSKKRLREVLKVQDSEESFLIALISDEEADRRNKKRDREYSEMKRREKGIKSHSQKKQEKIDAIKAVLKENPEFSVREIAKKTGISVGTVHNYLKEM